MKSYRLAGATLVVAIVAAALALVAGAIGGGSAQAAPAAPSAEVAGTMTIEGLEGAAALEIQSYSWGVSNPATIGTPGGGGGAGRAEFSAFNVLRALDAVSPRLVRAAATGEHFPSATIEVAAGKGTMRYTLDTVFVSSVQHSGSGKGSAESLSLEYGSIDVEAAP